MDLPKKIKIINWPKNSKLPIGISIGISIFALIVSIGTSIYSIYWSSKLNPLNEANLVLLTPSIELSDNEEDNNFENMDVNFFLKNIGHDQATNISFSLYTTTLNKEIDNSAFTTNKLYEDSLVNSMYQESINNIGAAHFKRNREVASGDLFFIINIKYTSKNLAAQKEEWLWYRYQAKTKTMFALLKKELNENEKEYIKEILENNAYIVDKMLNK
ncbi:hypothetical protein KKH39_03430 [Patescibacteria group bacterium]|nr:hypothetical protein [Patescibacteria group bacterium]